MKNRTLNTPPTRFPRSTQLVLLPSRSYPTPISLRVRMESEPCRGRLVCGTTSTYVDSREEDCYTDVTVDDDVATNEGKSTDTNSKISIPWRIR